MTCHGTTICMGLLRNGLLHSFMLGQRLSDRQREMVFDFAQALRSGRVPVETSLDLLLLPD